MNTLRQGNEIIGYRCWTCGGVFQSMWGETCNGCRSVKSENAKLREEIAKLTEAIRATSQPEGTQ